MTAPDKTPPPLPGEVWRGPVVLPWGSEPILCAIVKRRDGYLPVRNDGDVWPRLCNADDAVAVLVTWALALQARAERAETYSAQVEAMARGVRALSAAADERADHAEQALSEALSGSSRAVADALALAAAERAYRVAHCGRCGGVGTVYDCGNTLSCTGCPKVAAREALRKAGGEP